MTTRSPSRRLILKGALAAAALATLHRPSHADNALPDVIRLAGPGAGYGKNYGLQGLGLVRAKESLEKEFAGENVRIEWDFPTKAGPAINEGLAAGQIDFAAYGGLPNIIGRSRGLKTKILSSYGAGHMYLVVRKGAGIETIEDLRGKKIGLNRGSIGQLTLSNLLATHGLKESDVELFDITNPDQITGLTTGNLDFGWGGSNFLKLVKDGVADLLYSSKNEISPVSTFGSFLVTEEFAAAYPEATQRVLRVFIEESAWGSNEENREEVLDLWTLSGQSRTVMEEEFEGVNLQTQFSPVIDELYLAQLEAGIAFSLENKFIRSPIDLDEWVDRQPLDTVLQELNLTNFWPVRDATGAPVKA
ncbi:ABC transporter substrate-binding protein [Aureimonas fodinaquatilis]|nr:ABC transporter substrate-binding protein [Aureimonas fodinaquatilis]